MITNTTVSKFAWFALLLLGSQGFANETYPRPFSDPENKGQWIYNTEVSDEFEEPTINEDRWFIVGKFVDGKPTYVHPDKPEKRVWKGRAPSQFSGHNYRLDDGMLKLQARWEPDFPFEEEIHQPVFGEALPYENITTACFISRKAFKYGYIEICSKGRRCPSDQRFLVDGAGHRIRFFRAIRGRTWRRKGASRQRALVVHPRLEKLRGKPSYTERKDLGFRVADDFHVYGIEWDQTGIKYYIDGDLFSSVTAAEATAWARENREVDEDYNGYVATVPINLWLDMEVFPWHGIPESLEDLERNSPENQKHDGKGRISK